LDLGLTDAFVVKLASDLTPLWAKSFGDSAYDQTAKTVAVSSKGDVLLGGSFKGSLGVLGPSSTSNTALDAFLAQLSPTDGSVVCAHGYGDATGAQQVMTIAVARAATGALADSLLVSGTFQSQITLGTTPTLDTGGPATMSNSFVARAIP
jgi:hypothetical protein